jgi:transcriptional regulator with XRE-family HTH domain
MDLIAKRLVQIEIMNSLSAQQMAKIMGIGESTYYRYRAGDGYPDWKMLDNLVSRFKISGGWLFDRSVV